MSTSRAAIRSELSSKPFVPLDFLRRGYGVPFIVPEGSGIEFPVQPDAAEHDNVECDSFDYEAHNRSPGCLLVRGGIYITPLHPRTSPGILAVTTHTFLPWRFFVKDIDSNVLSAASMYWSMANTRFMLDDGPKTKERFAEILNPIIEHQLTLHKENPGGGNKLVADVLSQSLIDIDNM